MPKTTKHRVKSMDPTLAKEPPDHIREKRRRGRNLAVFFILLGFVILVYAITIVKIKLGHGS